MIFLQFSCNRLHVRLLLLDQQHCLLTSLKITDRWFRCASPHILEPNSWFHFVSLRSCFHIEMSAVTGAVKSAIVKMEDKYRSPYAIYRMAPFSMILNELEWLSKFLIHELNGNLPKPTIFVQWSFTTVLRITFGYVIYWCISCFMFIFACASSCCFNYVSTLPPLFREGTCVDVVFGNHARTKIK